MKVWRQCKFGTVWSELASYWLEGIRLLSNAFGYHIVHAQQEFLELNDYNCLELCYISPEQDWQYLF